MKIYNYHPETNLFICESIADESPLEPGIFLIPAYATTIKPPELQEGKTLHFENNEWVFKDIPEEVPEPVKPITEQDLNIVTMRQARLALHQVGLLSQVESAISAIENTIEQEEVKIEWEYSTILNRNHPWVQKLATTLGLNDTSLTDLFKHASQL